MKKALAMLLGLTLCIGLFAGCSNTQGGGSAAPRHRGLGGQGLGKSLAALLCQRNHGCSSLLSHFPMGSLPPIWGVGPAV